MSQFKRFNTSEHTRWNNADALPAGVLTWDPDNGLRLHDGTTASGNAIGGGGSALTSYAEDGQNYETIGVGNQLEYGGYVWVNCDGGIGMFGGTNTRAIADDAHNNYYISVNDEGLTNGVPVDSSFNWKFSGLDNSLTLPLNGFITAPMGMGSNTVIKAPASSGAILQDNSGSNLVTVGDNGIVMTTARGTVYYGFNLEAPGVPTHFHINKADQSFDLFFGDDANYLHLPAGGASPIIGANDGSSGQKLWTFGQDGSLTVPGAINSTAGTGSVVLNSNDGETTHTWTFGTDGVLTIPGNINVNGHNLLNVLTINGGNYSGSGLTLNPGVGAYLYSVYDGNVFVQTGAGGTVNHTWQFDTNGTLTFPDTTEQTTAYRVPAIGPVSAWGTNTPTPGPADSYTFYFDPTTGYPSMISSAWGGNGNPIWHSIWNVESWQQASGPTYSSSYAIAAGQPAEVGNIYPIALLGSALEPGDYTVVRIQDIDNNRIYRATFMGTWNPGTMVDTTHYGSITVERLF